jgi:signal transduction histidine kinase/sensor domain CHASE-containing protein/ActR/RegA family two-component response regulator
LLAREQGLIHQTVALATSSIQDAITEQIVSRMRSLERMVQHWETGTDFPQNVWEQEAALARRHDPYLHNIAWVDPTLQRLRFAPLADEESLLDQELAAETRQQRVLERARDTQEVQIIRVDDAGYMHQKLWIVVPFFRDTHFEGCLIGMLRLQALLTQIVEKVVEDFALVIMEHKELVYTHLQSVSRYKETLSQEIVISLPGLMWRGWLWPTSAVLTHQFFALPFAGLLMGFSTAVLLVSLTYYAQTAQWRALQLTGTNEALRESQQFLQSTLDALPASLVILEETGTIMAVNASWGRCVAAHGLPATVYGVGTNYLEFCAALSARVGSAMHDIIGGIRAVMAQEQTTFASEYACQSTAEPSWFLMRVTRFDGAEGIRVVVAHEDISEMKRAEETLRRQQEALVQSEKLAAMSGILASVAHELNNPLAVIMVQSDVLREHATEESDLQDLAAEINQSAVRCERIVRGFLALARPNAPERTRVQLNEVIAEVMPLLRYTLQLDDITVSLSLADDLPAFWGDMYQLQQVIVNLLTNAQQAVHDAPPPHQITVTTQYEAAQQAIRLMVADTGHGIPLALQHRIFDPFFTTKPPGIGTGLGLSLCQNIINGHGGRLWVESAMGQGACFVVELPVGEVPLPVATTAEAVSLPAVTGKTLLVVDDEVGTTKALVRLFQRDGHTVDTAGNGHVALARLRERSYDLILCDLRMPQLDGPGLYRLIAQEQPHLLPRFVFFTGDTLSPEAKTFLADSSAPYLVKPFRAAAVRQVVQQTLQRLAAA